MDGLAVLEFEPANTQVTRNAATILALLKVNVTSRDNLNGLRAFTGIANRKGNCNDETTSNVHLARICGVRIDHRAKEIACDQD